jgi:hypothetical protein
LARHFFRAGAVLAAIVSAPLAGHAVPVWATWTLDSATTATASVPDGRNAAFTGHPTIVNALGFHYVATPAVPGIPSGANAPSLTFVTNQPHPTQIDPGDLIFSLDLGSFSVDAETAFGIEDVVDFAFYRLELLDASLSPLSLASVQVTQFNLAYTTSTAVADYDLVLDPITGALDVIETHDAGVGATYRHSGMALLTNLPLATRFIRLYSNAAEPHATEGLRISLGVSPVPEPAPAAFLLAASLLALRRARGLRARRMHERRLEK